MGPYITWWDKQEVNVRNQQRPSQMQNESTGQAEHKILLFGNSVGPYITWWDKQEVNVRNQQRPSQMQNESTGIIVSVRSRSFLLGGGVFVVHNLS